MKKRHVFLVMIIFLLGISSVSAGFFDGFLSQESSGSKSNPVIFADMGIDGNKSEDWFHLKNLKISVTDKGTVLTNNGNGNAFYAANKPSTSMDNTSDLIEWNAPYTIEFDIVSDKGSSILITDNTNSSSRTFEQLGVKNNSHVKIVNNGSSINYYINGVSESVYTDDISISPSAIRFVIPQGSSLTYKNFTIS